MKKLLLAAALTLVTTGAAHAGLAHTNTGCGLGSMLWENKADNSAVYQAFQATTNGTSGSQTFGISSGTSNCQRPSKFFVQNEQLIAFVEHNMDNLAKDIAMGRGETLNTFAELLGVPAAETVSVNTKLQQNFNRIFPSDQVVVAEVIDNTLTVLNN